MTLVEKLIKLAEILENEGFIDESDQLTNAVEKDIQQDPTTLLIDKDDEEIHPMGTQEPSMSSKPPMPISQQLKQIPTENISKIEEDLTTGILALLAKNNDFVLSEEGEIGNSDNEFIDALLNLAP